MSPFLGVLLHAMGGFAAGSFYMPFKRVRNWAWESYWLVGGVFSWIVVPWLLGWLLVPDVTGLLSQAPKDSLFWTYLFGVLWGIGGLTFGLSMRYLGMSLGYALALGFCAAFGTIIPPIFDEEFLDMFTNAGGMLTLLGVVVCLGGIAVCGRAGARKEKELSDEQKTAVITEFNFAKGFWVAIFAGVMSACMAFGIRAGEPIAALAVQFGTPSLWQNTPVFIVVMAGGFTTNVVWCLALNIRNKTTRDYISGRGASIFANYLFSALAGTVWYCQFLFFGMGKTQMGRYDFSSWTLHMAFIIVFSNLWALLLHEWKGAGRNTVRLVFTGILVLIASTLVIGLGNLLAM
jgi:L-rhamnose-H+ transport protein